MHFSHIYFRSSTQQRGPRKLVFNKYWWIHSNPNPNSSLFILVISLSFCFLESWGSSASKIMNPNGCIICHCVEHVALVDRCSYTTEVRTFIQQPLMSINPISQFPAEWHTCTCNPRDAKFKWFFSLCKNYLFEFFTSFKKMLIKRINCFV